MTGGVDYSVSWYEWYLYHTSRKEEALAAYFARPRYKIWDKQVYYATDILWTKRWFKSKGRSWGFNGLRHGKKWLMSSICQKYGIDCAQPSLDYYCND